MCFLSNSVRVLNLSNGVFLLCLLSVRVQYRPFKSLDMPVERFLSSLRFEQREKLDQLGIKIGSFRAQYPVFVVLLRRIRIFVGVLSQKDRLRTQPVFLSLLYSSSSYTSFFMNCRTKTQAPAMINTMGAINWTADSAIRKDKPTMAVIPPGMSGHH